MRIAFLVSTFPAISETFILNQVTGLIERGHDVHILANEQGETPEVHADVVNYRLLKETIYSRTPKKPGERLLRAIPLAFSAFGKRRLLILRSLNVLKYGWKAASLRHLYDTVAFSKDGHYDIIHCHFGYNGLRGVHLREIGGLNGKIVTSFHGVDVNVRAVLRANASYGELICKGDFFTANSDFMLGRISSLGVAKERAAKLPAGVSVTRFPSVERRVQADDKVVMLTVARLVEVKGVEYAIRAVARLIPRFPKIEYNIVGDGPLRAELQNLVAVLGATDHIYFLGAQTADQIRLLYAQAHIFVLSSIVAKDGAEEAQGVVLLEAQATGLPVVATAVGGIPESVLDGKSAFLVPQRDVDVLADRIGYLIEHPEIWPGMGRAGRAHVEANYDIEKLNDRLVAIYEQVLSS